MRISRLKEQKGEKVNKVQEDLSETEAVPPPF